MSRPSHSPRSCSMTTMQRTADVAVGHATPSSRTARVRFANPLAAVALAAALAGGIVGGAVTAVASQSGLQRTRGRAGPSGPVRRAARVRAAHGRPLPSDVPVREVAQSVPKPRPRTVGAGLRASCQRWYGHATPARRARHHVFAGGGPRWPETSQRRSKAPDSLPRTSGPKPGCGWINRPNHRRRPRSTCASSASPP